MEENSCKWNNEVDETWAYYIDWSKWEEKNRYHILIHIYGV